MDQKTTDSLCKIVIINSCYISKITHLFITFPDPRATVMHELNILFFKFLWDGKRSKINETVVCKPYEDGGMNMLQ